MIWIVIWKTQQKQKEIVSESESHGEVIVLTIQTLVLELNSESQKKDLNLHLHENIGPSWYIGRKESSGNSFILLASETMNERKKTLGFRGTRIRQNYKCGQRSSRWTTSRTFPRIIWKSPTCVSVIFSPTHFHLPLQWRAKGSLPSNFFMPAEPGPPLPLLRNALVLFLPFFQFWFMPRKLPWWRFMLHLGIARMGTDTKCHVKPILCKINICIEDYQLNLTH